MGDKFDGVLAGHVRASGVSVSEAISTLSLHETLVSEDESGNTTLLRAVQNPYAGGLMMIGEPFEVDSPILVDAIKQSQMTSMLADASRCSKYARALSDVLQKHPGSRVVDIGTGTGLLAMLAARSGASHVDAIEMFEPLADLASSLIRSNGLHEKVQVIQGSSTELKVREPGGEKDNTIEERGDVLVTEIFDSALLGESCIPSIQHAHTDLLKETAITVPANATMFGVLVSSKFLARFHTLTDNFPLHRSKDGASCKSGSSGIPIHIRSLEEGTDLTLVSDAFEVFDFNFSRGGLKRYRQRSKRIARRSEGRADAVITWWELDLTGSKHIVYSTEPGAENWQDHWLQVVYPLVGATSADPQEPAIPITVEHDERTVSFAYGMNVETSERCRCGFHDLATPYRLFELGDEQRLERLSSQIRHAIEAISHSETSNGLQRIRCLDVSDNSVCAVLAGRLEIEPSLEVVSVEEDNEFSSFLFSQVAQKVKARKNDVFMEFEPLSSLLVREADRKQKDPSWKAFDVILSEPYTRSMHAYPIATLGNLTIQRIALSELHNDVFKSVPSVGRIQAQLLRFPPNTLQNSFKTINNVQGVNHDSFAELFDREDWCHSQRRISLPLFQYSPVLCSERTCVQEVNLSAGDNDVLSGTRDTQVKLIGDVEAEAVSFCVEYDEQEPSRVQRYEIVWLSDAEKQDILRSGGISVMCKFTTETGTWDIQMRPRE